MSRTLAKSYAKAYFSKAMDQKDKSGVDELAKGLIDLLIKKNDLKKVKAIFQKLKELEDDHLKRVRINVKSSNSLSEDDRTSISQAVKQATESEKVVIDESIDEELLGGTRLQIGWKVIDNTLKGRLNSLKEKLV